MISRRANRGRPPTGFGPFFAAIGAFGSERFAADWPVIFRRVYKVADALSPPV